MSGWRGESGGGISCEGGRRSGLYSDQEHVVFYTKNRRTNVSCRRTCCPVNFGGLSPSIPALDSPSEGRKCLLLRLKFASVDLIAAYTSYR